MSQARKVGTTPQRSFRISDDLWNKFRAHAAKQSRSASAELVKMIREAVEE